MKGRKIDNAVLIVILLGIGLSALYYFCLFVPTQKQIKSLNKTHNELNKKLTEYQVLANKIGNYEEDLEKLAGSQINFMESLPPEINEENIIVLIYKLMKMPEGVAPVTLQTVSLKEVEINKDLNEDSNDPEVKTDKIKSMDLSLVLQGRYNSIKQLLKNINDIKPKAIPGSIQISGGNADVSDPELNVSLTLSFLGYNGSLDSEYFENGQFLDEFYKYNPAGEKNRQNMFEPFVGMSKTASLISVKNIVDSLGTKTQAVDDFYVLLSPSGFDSSTITAGKTEGKFTYSLKNQQSKVDFVFDNKGGKYSFKCKTDNMTYPLNYSNMESFVPINNAKIILSISGNKIMEANDQVAAEVSIENNTNLPVSVVVNGITKGSNKLKIIGKKGLITEEWK